MLPRAASSCRKSTYENCRSQPKSTSSSPWKGDVTITNNVITVLKHYNPAARMLAELSKAQDKEVGGGTTLMMIIAGSLRFLYEAFSERDSSIISKSFQKDLEKGIETLTRLDPGNAVREVMDLDAATGVELRDTKLVKKPQGETNDDYKCKTAGCHPKDDLTRVKKAKIGLTQFSLSMGPMLRKKRAYILNLVKQIFFLFMIPDIMFLYRSLFLRDAALSDIALHFLNKMKITVARDIQREDTEVLSKFTGDMLDLAELAEGINLKVTVVHGSNKLVIDEAERSIHNFLCVICCLVKQEILLCSNADVMEVLPRTLAETAGPNPISAVIELRNWHVVQPSLVSVSALILATETVWNIVQIDDVVNT
ncbi:unnamed protein product [Nyctereutes procyonoides]|uniref:(raccoon dog) hypothetical protein n=1 Tax=Nyctereutes procyonoides TaxID=34880 RepID=A0A811YAU2_NYCPR|nr:unnamed protein product [Nyctereutes procyonoides]